MKGVKPVRTFSFSWVQFDLGAIYGYMHECAGSDVPGNSAALGSIETM